MCTGNCSGCTDCSGQCVPVGPRGLQGIQGIQGEVGPQGDSGNSYVTFIDLQPAFSLNTGDQIITGASYTIVDPGNYQIHISANVDLNLGAGGTSALSWYLDSTKIQQKLICDATTAPASLITKECFSFIWRGAVTANQVLTLRGQIAAGVTSCTVEEVSILINKEL